LRLRVPGLRRAESLRRTLEDELAEREGIHRVAASAVTGHVLILFEPEREAAAVIALVERVTARAETTLDEPVRARPPARNGGRTTGGAGRPAGGGFLGALFRSGGDGANGRGGSRERSAEPGRVRAGAEPPPGALWHVLPGGEVARRLGVEMGTGLLPGEVEERLVRYGPNRLARIEARSTLEILVGQVVNLPVALLLASAALSVATGGVGDAVAILAVVALNAVIGTVTESRAEQTIGSLAELAEPEASVIRNGLEVRIGAERVAVGDLLALRRGTWVPADVRLVEVQRLTVDESSLTGEALPVAKRIETLERPELPLADRVNMAYRGTLVTGGSGFGLVVATGGATEMGRIQSLIAGEEAPETPIQRQLGRMGREMVLVSTAVSAGVFAIGLLRGHSFLEVLKTTVSLAVAAVPEGLPAVATSTLAWGVRTLRSHDVLVRRLEAVETFGSVEVVCLDKTGTITANRMRVVRAFAGGRRFGSGNGGLSPENGRLSVPELVRLLEAATLCSEADVEDGEVTGSPTETALVRAALDAGIDVEALRARRPLRRIEQRAESRMYMVTEHDLADRPGGGVLVSVKGRPDEILDLCHWHMVDGERLSLREDDRLAIEEENERMAGDALRVLGVAFREDGSAEEPGGLTWLGLVGMVDPPREGMAELVERFRRAGVRTLMITGDQSATATAVGRQIGLASGGEMETLDSTAVDRIDPRLLSALVRRVHVFSRVSPSHKLQLVRALQADGTVVAMTGDGINDGPALKAADIGIAMGGGGAELAREVADVVLSEDRIESLLTAVAHGRTTHEDIRKAVHFIASTNLSEILFTFTSVAAGMGLPFGPKQLLWINLLTDVFPEIALAVEPPEEGTLDRPPKDPTRPIISGAEYRRIGLESGLITATAMASYGYGRMRYGAGPRANTIAFLSLTGAQLLHTFSSRSEEISVLDGERLPENRLIPWAVGGGIAIQVVGETFGALRRMLGTVRIGPADALISAGSALLSFGLNEGLKVFRRSRRRRMEEGQR
jgi:Ca2+-transporting ATPase